MGWWDLGSAAGKPRRRLRAGAASGGRLPGAMAAAPPLSFPPSLPLLVPRGRPIAVADSGATAWRSKDAAPWRSLAGRCHGATARPAPAGPPLAPPTSAPPEVDPAAPGGLDFGDSGARCGPLALLLPRAQASSSTGADRGGLRARGAAASVEARWGRYG